MRETEATEPFEHESPDETPGDPEHEPVTLSDGESVETSDGEPFLI